jgi:ribosome biogenesis protein YTM1
MDTDQASSLATEINKIRVTLVSLDPTYTVPTDDMAVPASIRTTGLNKLVNYLLSGSDSDNDSDSEEEEEEGKPAKGVQFDFMINNRFLRTTLAGYVRANNVSAESVVTVHFLPKLTKPDPSKEENNVLPDWISSLYAANGVVFSGCYDGSIRAHDDKSLAVLAGVPTHKGAVKCLAVHATDTSKTMTVATGGHDQSVHVHEYTKGAFNVLAATERHGNSVSSLAFRGGAGDRLLATGDFDGNLSLFKMDDEGSTTTTTTSSDKKRKAPEVKTVAASTTTSLHHGAITGLAFGTLSPNLLFTGSHDYSVRSYDVERGDPVLTLNGSRVVSAFGKAHHTDVVATGHPDSHMKMWDVRASKDSVASLTTTDDPLKPSHKEYVSDLAWDPVRPFVLSSCSYDGTVKTWDIRCSLPLYTVRAQKRGEGDDTKGMAVAYNAGGQVFAAGSDCVVRKF